MTTQQYQKLALRLPSFWLVAVACTQITADVLEAYDDLFSCFKIYPGEMPHLFHPQSVFVKKYALVMSYGTLIIEGVIAASFLLRACL